MAPSGSLGQEKSGEEENKYHTIDLLVTCRRLVAGHGESQELGGCGRAVLAWRRVLTAGIVSAVVWREVAVAVVARIKSTTK